MDQDSSCHFFAEQGGEGEAAAPLFSSIPNARAERLAADFLRPRAWLPHYLHWYRYALTHRPRRAGSGAGAKRAEG